MSQQAPVTHDEPAKSQFSTAGLGILKETALHYERLLHVIPRTALDSAIHYPSRSRVALLGAVVVAGIDYHATKALVEKSTKMIATQTSPVVSPPMLNPVAKAFTSTVTAPSAILELTKVTSSKLPRTCTRCGLASHIAADCPNKATAAAWKAALAEAVCFRCGGKGHVKAHCTNTVKKPERGFAAAAAASWRQSEQVTPGDAPEAFPPLPGKQSPKK